jgi:hypothetical protein
MDRGEFNHTDTTRSHISGNHDGALALLEFVENPITLLLLLVTVDGKGWPAVLSEEASDLVGDTLGASEDEALVVLVLHDLLEVLDHLVALLELGNDLDDLGDAVVGGKVHGTDVDLDEVVLEVLGERANLLGPCSGPHASLTVRANLAKNLADLGLETHVEHTISLIEDEVGNAAKVGLSRLEHVDQTARGGDTHLDTASEISDLLTLGDTTVDTGVANARRFAELVNFSLNLDSELTGGGEDEDDGTVTGREERLGVDVDDRRKTVGEGLSGTGLGNTSDIATGESHGPALALNGGGVGEALGLDLVDHVAGETSLVEGLDGLGDVLSLDGDLVKLAESIDILLGALGNGRCLLVEGLLELGEGGHVCEMVSMLTRSEEQTGRHTPLLRLEAGTKLAHSVAALAAIAATTVAALAVTTAVTALTTAAVATTLATAVAAGSATVER